MCLQSTLACCCLDGHRRLVKLLKSPPPVIALQSPLAAALCIYTRCYIAPRGRNVHVRMGEGWENCPNRCSSSSSQEMHGAKLL